MKEVVSFRQIERSDLELLRDWRNSPDVRLICREYRLLNMPRQQQWFESLTNDTTLEMYIVTLGSKVNVKDIGVAGWTFIDWRSRHALLSMYIGDSDHRDESTYLALLNRLHVEAFHGLNMHTVRAEVYDFCPYRGVFEKAGYTNTGKCRERYYHDGQYHDLHLYDMTRKEWDERDG
jgi:RimJ/RimL family protein N-acetyltransferase